MYGGKSAVPQQFSFNTPSDKGRPIRGCIVNENPFHFTGRLRGPPTITRFRAPTNIFTRRPRASHVDGKKISLSLLSAGYGSNYGEILAGFRFFPTVLSALPFFTFQWHANVFAKRRARFPRGVSWTITGLPLLCAFRVLRAHVSTGSNALAQCFPTWGPRPTGRQFDC